MIPLTAAARDTLLCLFIHGPTWDGNVPSKTGRDELFADGHIKRGKGYQWLTDTGMAICFDLGFAEKKDSHESKQRRARQELLAENERLKKNQMLNIFTAGSGT